VRIRATTVRTPSLRWLVPRNAGAASASAATASLRTFEGPEPNLPSRGRRLAGRTIGAPLTGSRYRRVPRIEVEFRVARGRRVEELRVPDRMPRRREPEQLELARRTALG